MKKLQVLNYEIHTKLLNNEDHISLTDIAKKINLNMPRFTIQNWMRNKSTIDYIGLWELINNSNFNRIEFDTIKLYCGYKNFSMSPTKWINKTNAIGFISKAGKYDGGTYAHIDIALEFASWISPEFKLYIYTEFKRQKK